MMQCRFLKQNIPVLLVIALLLIAGIPAVLAAAETTSPSASGGTIIVTSYPVGAAVSLDGEYRGVTPTEFDNLAPGEYSVTVALDGYKTETIPSVLHEGTRQEIMVQLESLSSVSSKTADLPPLSRYGSIAIDSTPGGALVTLDGNAAGRTPMTHTALILNSVPVGNHVVRVELAGYLPYTTQVTVTKNQVLQVNAELSANSPPTNSQPAPSAVPSATAQRSPTRQSGVLPVMSMGAVCIAGSAYAIITRPWKKTNTP
jgi:hypothetical protein